MTQVFLVAAPRSGAGLLHEMLKLDSKWSATDLSGDQLWKYFPIDAGTKPSSDDSKNTSHKSFEDFLKTQVQPASSESGGYFVDYQVYLGQEIAALAEAFPDARFVVVERDPASTILSTYFAWQSGQFKSKLELPGWWGSSWAFPLIPSWEDLIGAPIEEIVCQQYLHLEASLLKGISSVPRSRWALVRFEDLLSNPQETMTALATELGLEWQADIPKKLPKSQGAKVAASGAANAGIKRFIVSAMNTKQSDFQQLAASKEEVFSGRNWPASNNGKPGGEVPKKESTGNPMKVIPSAGTALEARHAGGFRELLRKAKASIVFTAYNSGYLGVVRATESGVDTSYIRRPKPMGLAIMNNKLSISTIDSIEGFQRQDGLSKLLAGKEDVDALFVPQSKIYTGDIAVHDMAYGTAPGAQGLWFINSAFSCLSKLHPDYSFVPAWRPKWISSLSNENRCHLNGLAMVDGKPKYVTSLSQSDEPRGWRAHKGTSGVIVDITTNRIVASGLSMPHSPRWHKGKLYFLESGKGSLASVDHRSGEVTTIATLPGFTRGLAFIANYALVGLSQVRDSVFSDLPVTSSKHERNCGIWVIDLRDGKTVGFLKFQGVIQELFDIAVVENTRWPSLVERIPETLNAFTLPKSAIKDTRPARVV